MPRRAGVADLSRTYTSHAYGLALLNIRLDSAFQVAGIELGVLGFV